MMKENKIASDVENTKCELRTALDTDACLDKNYENETKNVSQSISLELPKSQKLKLDLDFKIYWRTNS